MNKIYKFSIIFFLVPLLFLAGCTAKKFFQLGQTFDAGNIVPSVSISNDGRRISVGTGSSQVQIYELNNNPTSNNNVWAPLGAPITGVVAQLSGDGARVVVSDLTTVKMYTYSGVAWTQQGATLSLSVGSGFDTISINTDGTVVGFGQLSGNIARIYNFNGAAWTQLGATLTGSLVSLSVDGLKVAIGDFTNSTVKIYNYSGATWNQQGGTIMTGCVSVSLFNDTVAIGTVESGEGYVQVYEYKAGVWSLLGTRLQVASDRIGTTVSLTLQRDALDSLFPNYQVLTASSFPGNRLYSFFYNSLSRSWDLTEIPNGEILNSPFGRVSSSGILNKQVPVINDEGKITGTKTVYFSRFISSILPAKVFTSEVVEEPASVAETASPFPVNLARATISSGPGNPLPSLGVSTPAGINPFMALTNNQAAAQTQLSQQTFVYNGDSSLSFFFINVPGSPYNGKFFQCSNLQGALSFSNNSYQFRQTGSVTGTVYELDQTTVFASDITLTAGQFFNVSLTGTFDPKTNVLTVTDITGGTITAGTFTGGITITGTITNGSAFTGVTVTAGTLNGLSLVGATFAGTVTSAAVSGGTFVFPTLTGATLSSATLVGTITLPAPTPPQTAMIISVTLTGATLTGVTATGTLAGNVFTGTAVSAGAVTAGTFTSDTVTSASLASDPTPTPYTLGAGLVRNPGAVSIAGGTFTAPSLIETAITGGTFSGGVLSGATITGASMIGNVTVVGAQTNVILTSGTLTGVSITGTLSGSVFIGTEVTAGTITIGTFDTMQFSTFSTDIISGTTPFTVTDNSRVFPDSITVMGTITALGTQDTTAVTFSGTYGFGGTLSGVDFTGSGTDLVSTAPPTTLTTGNLTGVDISGTFVGTPGTLLTFTLSSGTGIVGGTVDGPPFFVP